MNSRYNHWFWNSCFVDFFAHKLVRVNSWLWKMQYGRE